VRAAVAWPVDEPALAGVRAAADHGLLEPVLVGDRRRFEATAGQHGIDLGGWEVVPVEDSHAAAERAVALGRAREVGGIVKGALHTDVLMAAVVHPEKGLEAGRRVSHVFVMDVPAYPRPLLLSDAAIHISPDLEEKADISRNAIHLAHVLGRGRPRVAVLSAVETVTSRLRSTVEAAALCKMAHRGQIEGADIEGPLAFDTAVSEEAARLKGLDSPVPGRADVLLAPDLESGNLLYKQLEHLGGARVAGVAVGARIPIALTSRADPVEARVASCALMALLAAAGVDGD